MLDPKNVRNGKEQFERFERRHKEYVQYDYRDLDGMLFSTVRRSLDECRQARDEWLGNKDQLG